MLMITITNMMIKNHEFPNRKNEEWIYISF